MTFKIVDKTIGFLNPEIFDLKPGDILIAPGTSWCQYDEYKSKFKKPIVVQTNPLLIVSTFQNYDLEVIYVVLSITKGLLVGEFGRKSHVAKL